MPAPRTTEDRSRAELPSLVALALALALAACRASQHSVPGTDAGKFADASAYPAPRTDLVPSVGSDETLEVATWNIEHFPKNSNTPAITADLIASLDLDFIALQEIEDAEAFEELLSRLRGYEGLLSSHTYSDGTYQKVGYIYRSEFIEVTGPFLLFSQNGYEFPRPPFKVDVRVDTGTRVFNFTSIALHLKAGGSFQDRQRRQDAVVILENHLRSTVDGSGNANLLVLGDFNATLSGGAAAFEPLVSNLDRYTIRTTANANTGEISFVPSSVLLDHIVTTAELDTVLPGSTAIIPRLDMQMTGYVGQVSDHLPVIIRTPL